MASDASVCPYCNAVLPGLPAPPTVEKLPCPRCGEPVPASRWQVSQAVPPSLTLSPRMVGVPAHNLRSTALIVLGIMCSMAIIGLSYALWTTKLRQARHPWMPNKVEPIAFRQPLQLTGLGYLPKGTQVVAALQVAEWLDAPAGKQLLEEPRPGLLEWVLKQITRATGLKIEQIDHVVLASTLDTQLVMIVTTRQPYSLPKIVDAVQPVRSSNYQGQPLYEYALKPAGNGMLWCVEERTMIFVLRLDTPNLEHLSGLSATPRQLEVVLPAPVRTLIEERLAKQNLAWAVGRLDQGGMLVDWLPLLLGGNADMKWVKSTKAFTLGISPGDGLTMTGNFQMSDAKAAAKFKAVLDDIKLDGMQSRKAETTPADAAEAWLTWQVRGEAAALRGLFDRAKK